MFFKQYATSGVPFADTPSTGSYGDGANVTAYPSVSLTPAAGNTALLWFGTAWNVGHSGNFPAGWTNIMDSNTLSLGYALQVTPAPVTLAPTVSPTNLLTAALMTFR